MWGLPGQLEPDTGTSHVLVGSAAPAQVTNRQTTGAANEPQHAPRQTAPVHSHKHVEHCMLRILNQFSAI
jgi:hypothetical protein